jgi:hypothetical protein
MRARLFPVVCILALSHLGWDCGGASSRDLSAGATPPLTDTGEGADGGVVDYTKRGNDAAGLASHGSPFCFLSTGCIPDTTDAALLRQMCDEPAAPDGGATAALACRVSSATQSTACTIAGTGKDGAACIASSDCAAGYECTQNGCRPYCCERSCNTFPNTYCDFAHRKDDDAVVPVCLPFKHCTLMADAGNVCDPGSTCAVVREDGSAGCVPIGPAKKGESCDEFHCEADLSCLGQPGSRTCFQLCRTGSPECGSNQACRSTTVVSGVPGLGVCL